MKNRKPDLIVLLLVALITVGCGASPIAPTKVYTAALSVSQLVIGTCVDVRCAYSAVVTNAGPDCATRVSVAYAITEPPFRVPIAVGIAAGTLRPGQSLLVSGTDWPRNVSAIEPFVTGDPIACP